MLMLMFNFLKVSLKYGSTGAHSHTLRYFYFPCTYWVMYVTQLYLRKVTTRLFNIANLCERESMILF